MPDQEKLGRPAPLIGLISGFLLALVSGGFGAGSFEFLFPLSSFVFDRFQPVLQISLICLVSIFAALTIHRWRDLSGWIMLLVVASTVFLLLLLAQNSCSDTLTSRCNESSLVGLLSPLGLAIFIVLFFYRSLAESNEGWQNIYPRLFTYSWSNFLVLSLAQLLLWIFVGVLMLWAGLFALLGIEIFADVFKNPWLMMPLCGLAFGYGIRIFLRQDRLVEALQKIIYAMFYGLLPVICLLLITFVLALPFAGLEKLFATRHATFMLLWLLALLFFFLNAVYQDGKKGEPYPQVLRWLVIAALPLSIVPAAISAYAISLRVQQYGWTVDRFWGVVVLLSLSALALAYASSFIRRRGQWVAVVTQSNTILAVVLLGVFLLTQTPLLDPKAVSANSQLKRLEQGKIQRDELDLDYLRFSLEKPGERVLKKLQVMYADDDEWVLALEKLLSSTSRWNGQNNIEALTEKNALDYYKIFPRDHEVQASFIEFLGNGYAYNCTQAFTECALVAVDINQDDDNEYIVAVTQSYGNAPVKWVNKLVLYRRLDDKWLMQDHLQQMPSGADGNSLSWDVLIQSLEKSGAEIKTVRRKELVIGDSFWYLNPDYLENEPPQ